MVKKIRTISVDFLQDYSAWIWLPNEVEFLISDDKKKFKSVGIIQKRSSEKKSGKFTETFQIDFSETNTRFIKVITKSLLQCPIWHLGAGGDAWIFADEIVVK